MSDYVMRSGQDILEALDQASRGVQAASTELSKLSQEFHEAHIEVTGEIVNGLALQFKIAVDEEVIAIYEMALASDMKPPATDVRAAMAERAVRVKHPELWAKYNAMDARINALKTWVVNQKAVISANQSIRRAEAI